MAAEKTASQVVPMVQRANDYKAFYCNHVQAGFTPFDIFLILSEAAASSDGTPLIEQRARMTVSPVQALLISKFLEKTVRTWELNTGQTVIIPEGIIPEAEPEPDNEGR